MIKKSHSIVKSMSNQSDFLKHVEKFRELYNTMQQMSEAWMKEANDNYEENHSSHNANVQNLAYGATIATDGFKKFIVLMDRRTREIMEDSSTKIIKTTN